MKYGPTPNNVSYLQRNILPDKTIRDQVQNILQEEHINNLFNMPNV